MKGRKGLKLWRGADDTNKEWQKEARHAGEIKCAGLIRWLRQGERMKYQDANFKM